MTAEHRRTLAKSTGAAVVAAWLLVLVLAATGVCTHTVTPATPTATVVAHTPAPSVTAEPTPTRPASTPTESPTLTPLPSATPTRPPETETPEPSATPEPRPTMTSPLPSPPNSGLGGCSQGGCD